MYSNKRETWIKNLPLLSLSWMTGGDCCLTPGLTWVTWTWPPRCRRLQRSPPQASEGNKGNRWSNQHTVGLVIPPPPAPAACCWGRRRSRTEKPTFKPDLWLHWVSLGEDSWHCKSLGVIIVSSLNYGYEQSIILEKSYSPYLSRQVMISVFLIHFYAETYGFIQVPLYCSGSQLS